MSLLEELVERVRERAEPDAAEWFASALAATVAPLELQRFAGRYAGAGRRLGLAPIGPLGAPASTGLDLTRWGLDEVGRAALLLKASEALEPDGRVALVEDLYLRGTNRERTAALKILSALPHPERFLRIAVESCRSNVEPVFCAIATHNPYPAAWFPEPNFNQMVLKAIFLGLGVDSIDGIAGRVTPELVRMAEGYGSERAAAGRSVPDDIARLRRQLETAEAN